jgi:hypothetical protein
MKLQLAIFALAMAIVLCGCAHLSAQTTDSYKRPFYNLNHQHRERGIRLQFTKDI